MKLSSDIKTCKRSETIKKDANALSLQLQVKAVEFNSFYMYVCVCVLFKTNFDVDLKLIHVIPLYVFILNLCQGKKKKKILIIEPGCQVQQNKTKIKTNTFHILQKGSKKQFVDIKRNLIQPFAQCNHRTGKSPYNLYIWHGFF